MENFAAIPIRNIGFTLSKICDFIYHEGPLLSLFVNQENHNQYYFYKWADCDDDSNRWMVFHISLAELKEFMEKKINLRSIIVNNPYVFYIDLNDDLLQMQCFMASSESIPEGYMPSDDSYFKHESYTPEASAFKDIISKSNNSNILECLLSEVRQQSADIKSINETLHSLMVEGSTDMVKMISTNVSNNLFLISSSTN